MLSTEEGITCVLGVLAFCNVSCNVERRYRDEETSEAGTDDRNLASGVLANERHRRQAKGTLL